MNDQNEAPARPSDGEVERVAWAIYAALPSDAFMWRQLPEPSRECYRKQARAAIAEIQKRAADPRAAAVSPEHIAESLGQVLVRCRTNWDQCDIGNMVRNLLHAVKPDSAWLKNEPPQHTLPVDVLATARLKEIAEAVDEAGCKGLVTLFKVEDAIQRMQQAEARVAELEALIHAMWRHNGYPDCGYGQMTTPQKELYLKIINRPGQPKKAEQPAPRGEGDGLFTVFTWRDGLVWISGKHGTELIWGKGATQQDAIDDLCKTAAEATEFENDDPMPDWSRVNAAKRDGGGVDVRERVAKALAISSYSLPGSPAHPDLWEQWGEGDDREDYRRLADVALAAMGRGK